MLPTYPATLRNGQLEWGSEGAPPLAQNEAVQVNVTVLPPVRTESDRAKVFALLEALAARGTAFAEIEDVVAWQREQRKDRPLPGRDE